MSSRMHPGFFLVKYQCQTKLSSVLVQVNRSECTDLVIAIIQESEQATALMIAKHNCENKNILRWFSCSCVR